MLGYSAVEWAENDDLFLQLLHPEDRERVLAAHHRTHTTREPLFIEYRLRTRDGRYLWVQDEARVVAEGEPVLQGYLLDITARKDAEEQLRHQAFHDALTGLANRSLFTNRVEHALVLRSQRLRPDVAVLFLDLDDFKGVNDTLGHAAGDALLRVVGVRLREALSPSYTVARLGGDEFAVLIEDGRRHADGRRRRRAAVGSLQTPFELEGREVFVTASVGIALGTRRGRSPARSGRRDVPGEGFGQGAVRAVRAADGRGSRGGASSWSPSCAARAARTSSSSTTSRSSTSRAAPSSASRRSSAGSIPTRGLLPPDEFIPLAEETGKIVELGTWVLARSLRTGRALARETPGAAELSLNVNVSTRQVRPGVLVESVRCRARRVGATS